MASARGWASRLVKLSSSASRLVWEVERAWRSARVLQWGSQPPSAPA